MVVDSIARQVGIDMRKLEKSAAVGRGELLGKKIILAKPVTFMNNSGESVAALARFYKVGPCGACCSIPSPGVCKCSRDWVLHVQLPLLHGPGCG